MIILTIILALALIIGLALLTSAIGLVLAFSDFIVAGFVIWWVIKLIKKHKKGGQ